jgi:hypothetical protein
MEGSPTASSDEPACTVGGLSDASGYNETNPGCQEIAPMSGEMSNSICEDDITVAGGVGNTTSGPFNVSAESLAVCADGIAVVTDNLSHSQFGDSAAACASATGTSPNGSSASFGMNVNYAGAGKLRRSGTLPVGTGSYALSDWKDVLRVVYTGCKNTDGTCVGVNRIQRCTDPVRLALVSHWDYLVESGDATLGSSDTAVGCGHTNCPSGADAGIRAAYRRDDASGTTGFFLGTLGLSKNVKRRTTLVGGTALAPRIAAIPADANSGNIFCDGGDIEGMFPDGPPSCTAAAANACQDSTGAFTVTCPSNGVCPTAPRTDAATACTAGTANQCLDFATGLLTVTCPASGQCPKAPERGDPATKPCRAESGTDASMAPNLCASNGRIGVVRALVSPILTGAYPTLECSPGKWQLKQYITTSLPLCPDGTVPLAGQCYLPYFSIVSGGVETGRDFNCINFGNNRPPGAPLAVDGRVYNQLVRDSSGALTCLTGSGLTCTLPMVAQWREHMATLNTSPLGKGGTIGTLAGTATVCQEPDSTRNMGCITGKTQCTIGFAGREVASNPPSSDLQEAFRINNSTPTDGNVLGFLADAPTPSATDYVFARNLYLGAIGGFPNIAADCTARGGTKNFCNDEIKMVQAFTSNYNTQGGLICAQSGFIPLTSTLHECRGAKGASATNSCGAGGTLRANGTLAPADDCQPPALIP